jgi:uncharacterized membrane protein YfcA
MNESTLIYFLSLLPIVAFLYASVGHGGASGYLALMALLGFAPDVMKPTALVLNCLVSLISFAQFYRTSKLNWKLFFAFATGSIPLAFLGGGFHVNQTLYKIILGILLLIPSFRLLFSQDKKEQEVTDYTLWTALSIGAGIGFLSGLIGIGGGILLSPIILYFRWASFKQTAGISALFIFVNSVAGLLGNASISMSSLSSLFEGSFIFIPFLAVAGGLLGGYYGAGKFNLLVLKRVLGLVLIIASLKLIWV